MLNLAALTEAATGDPVEEVPVSRRFLAQVVAEITAGRDAHSRLGQVFGLAKGQAL